MARNTSTTGNNELKIHDNVSDSDIVLFYRTPTTKERQEYQNLALQRKGKKVTFNQAEARLVSGLKILTGFREGDFVRDVLGAAQPYSSDKNSPHYLEEWKTEVEAGASDLIMLLAAHVFDASAEIVDPEDGEGN